MRRQFHWAVSLGCTLAMGNLVHAQFGRGAAEWTTGGGDAQRSSWVRSDPKISRESLQKPGFQVAWTVKVNHDSSTGGGLAPAVLLDRYIGYRGFRSLAFFGGADNVFAIDTDLGRLEWQKHFAAAPAGSASGCAAGMITSLTRPTPVEFPMTPVGRGGGGGGRGGPARSGVGEANAGAVTIVEVAAPRGGAPGGPGGRAPNRGPGGGGDRRAANFLYALSSDGMLHAMYVSNGEEPEPPVKFLPAGAHAHGLIFVDGVAYVATSQGCGGAPDGVWALDMASKQVTNWKAEGGSVAGAAGPALGPDGTLYVSTAGGGLVALAPKTLAVKGAYTGKQPLTSTPVIFQHKDTSLVAATTKEGRVILLDPSKLDAQPIFQTPPSSGAADFTPGALASWQDTGGIRWLLVPTANSITAWKVVEQNGAPALESGWVSPNLASPLPPMIVNGVVFALSGGDARTNAVLYALDGATGKELWTSGKAMTSFVRGGGLSGGSSQLYVGTNDGTIYAFGFPIEH